MKQRTKIRYKYKGLKADLLAKIRSGALADGGRLESEPKLAERLHLSRNTIRQALRELEEEGYVYRVHGKGTFLRNSAPQELNKIALLIYDAAYVAHPVTGGLIRGIDETLRKNGFFLDVLASSRSFQDESLKNLAERYAGFLIGTHQLDALTLAELPKIRRPYLFVKNYPPDREAPSARIDFQKAGFLAVAHLAETGCRNLSLLCPGKEIAIADDFREGVRSGALEYGLKLRGENSFSVDFSGLDAVPDICGELLTHDERVDGVVHRHSRHGAGTARRGCSAQYDPRGEYREGNARTFSDRPEFHKKNTLRMKKSQSGFFTKRTLPVPPSTRSYRGFRLRRGACAAEPRQD